MGKEQLNIDTRDSLSSVLFLVILNGVVCQLPATIGTLGRNTRS